MTRSKITHNKAMMFVFFVCLTLSIAFLDQTTKRHAQKTFLTWSHPTELSNYHSSAYELLRFGKKEINDASVSAVSKTANSNWYKIEFTYVRNTGAIWGFLHGLPNNASNILFSLLYPIFVLFLCHTFYTTHHGQRLLRFSISCIIGGAIGNFIDRIAVGYVVDWIHPQWRIFSWEYSYPVFNVADITIVGGVCIWFLDALLDVIHMKKCKPITAKVGSSHE